MEDAVRGARDPPISVEDQYQYEALVAGDAVRVLNLEPADDSQSPLCGFITQHQPAIELLDPDGCRYSAVSYTWGDPTPSHKLFLRLNTEWTFLPITRNADSLLRHLRVAHKKKTLWIDGICLNQKDEGEKTEQIRVMGQIYAYAKKVHIWLGDDEMEDAQQAFSLIRRIEFDESRTLDSGTDEFLRLERLFNRPWFSRRWVVQETFFSHNAVFHCGHHTLSLSRVMAVLAKATIQGWSELPGVGLRMLRSTIGVGQMQSPRQGLLSLLWDLHESECAERRDRVAALYSLSDAHERPPLHYNIGDWKMMYKDVASYCANNSDVTAYTLLLHLCSFGSIHSSTASEIPSWVPDWSKKRQEPIAFETRQAEDLHHNNLGIPINRGLDRSAMPMKVQVLGHKLQVNYDPSAFTSGCGIVDQVVYPFQSEDFWDEVVELARWRNEARPAKELMPEGPRESRHMTEVDSLSSLLISLLEVRGPTSTNVTSSLKDSVLGLCNPLLLGYGPPSKFQTLTDDQRGLIQRFRSAVDHLVIARVQATMGYYWAIGPPNLGKGDWFVPVIQGGEGMPMLQEPNLTQCMCLRSIGSGVQRDAWYPSPGSDLDRRLHRYGAADITIEMPEVDCMHLTARFVGSGGTYFPLSYYGSHSLKKQFREISIKATEAASRKGLHGPIIFDIV